MKETPCILRRLADHALVQPDKPAFFRLNQKIEVEEYYTYAQLHDKVISIANDFNASDGWVLLLFQNSFEFIPYFLAAIQAGITPCCQEIPNSSYKLARLIQKIEKYGVEQVLVQPDIFEKKWFQKLWAQVEEPHKSKFRPAGPVGNHKDCAGASSLQDSDIAFVQFTSGTTSEAKALGITHDNLNYVFESPGKTLNRTANTISLNWLPHYHDLGLIDGLLTGIYQGSSTYLMESNHFIANPMSWLHGISRYAVTHSSAPNFAYDLCVSRFSYSAAEGLDLYHVQSLLLGGEMVKVRTLQRFAEQFSPYGLNEQRLLTAYGMAETTLGVTCQAPDLLSNKYTTLDGNLVVSCGSVFEGTSAMIINNEGEPVPENTIGNIVLSGRGVARRFREGCFEDIAFVKTGDIGFIANKQLYLLGRVGDLMIKNGQNYALSEIEEIVSTAHPALYASGIVALLNQREDFTENFEVVAELRRGACQESDYALIIQAIRRALVKALGLFPDRVSLLSYWSIPRTSSGKKQKQLLRDQLQQRAIQPLSQSDIYSVESII